MRRFTTGSSTRLVAPKGQGGQTPGIDHFAMGVVMIRFQLASRARSAAIIATGALVMFLVSGCAFSESSGSFSDSSGSVSDSLGSGSDSSTSSSGGEDEAYRDDVRDFTIAVAGLNGSPDELRRGLAEIALGRGVSDWEQLGSTFSSIGEGLARADVSAERMHAYQVSLARPGSEHFEAIAAGYEGASQ